METTLDKLPRDVLIYIALQMDLPEILSLCRTSSRINEIVCENDKFWMNKVMREYPKIFNSRHRYKYGKTFKEIHEYVSQEYIYIDLSYKIEHSYYDEDDFENSDEINLGIEMEIDTRIPPTVLKDLIYDVLKEFGQYHYIFGYYDVFVNGDETTCQFSKFLRKECLEDVDKDTKEVHVILDSQEMIDPDNEGDYENQLRDISVEFVNEYLEKYGF